MNKDLLIGSKKDVLLFVNDNLSQATFSKDDRTDVIRFEKDDLQYVVGVNQDYLCFVNINNKDNTARYEYGFAESISVKVDNIEHTEKIDRKGNRMIQDRLLEDNMVMFKIVDKDTDRLINWETSFEMNKDQKTVYLNINQFGNMTVLRRESQKSDYSENYSAVRDSYNQINQEEHQFIMGAIKERLNTFGIEVDPYTDLETIIAPLAQAIEKQYLPFLKEDYAKKYQDQKDMLIEKIKQQLTPSTTTDDSTLSI